LRISRTEDPNEHPARKAARLSRTYFAQRNKPAWLDLWAEDGVIMDPLGASFMDPEAKGFRSPEEREKWWDDHYNLEFYYSMLASFVAGNQVANYETLIVVGDVDGKRGSYKCEGIWTYEVDVAGKLLSMIGYWEEDAMQETYTELPNHQFYVE
jgi:steroid delta-isomerase